MSEKDNVSPVVLHVASVIIDGTTLKQQQQQHQ